MNKRAYAILNLFPAAARTASANGSSVNLAGYADPGEREMLAYLDVGAASGTSPTLDVRLQDSADGTTWADISGAAFAQKTGVAQETIYFSTARKFVRAVATIGGTSPSFTFGCYLMVARRLA